MKTMELRFTLNGQAKEWTIAAGEILLDVLRREGYFGTKRGCETGECGACTILLDGKPVNSCLMFAAQAEGREIVTIEGIAHGDQLDPVQEAFLDCGAVQCGFCTGGMVLTAKALLERQPDPSEADVREALAGNLCRCTGYCKPVDAVMAAAHSKKRKDVEEVR
jgi:aerobic-type carbon monoxide dehydrogenase small subunit (CoxS/CutS family)